MVHQQFIRSATCTVYPRLHNINSTTNANANASMMSLWAGGARGGRFMATTGSRSACTSTNRATAMRMNRRSTNTNNRYGCSILYRCRSTGTPSTNINATACRFRSNPAKQKPGNRSNSNKPRTRSTSTSTSITSKSVDEGKAVESAIESVEGQVAAAASSEAVMEASPSPHQLMMHALRSAVPMIGMCIM